MFAGRVALVVCLSLAAIAPAPGRGDDDAPPPFLRLEYRAVTTNESAGENVQRKAPLVPRTEGTFVAVLGPRRVELVEETRRTVLDYEHERILRVEPDGSYRESSLLAQVAFTGAWKDLGGMYCARFDTERAWLAWEAGRRAAPEHPMWSRVREFESRLRTQYRNLL